MLADLCHQGCAFGDWLSPDAHIADTPLSDDTCVTVVVLLALSREKYRWSMRGNERWGVAKEARDY